MGDLLICGTASGAIKVIDIWKGQPRGNFPDKPRGAAIVDVKVHGDELVSIDSHGDIKVWRLDRATGDLVFLENVPVPVDDVASDRVRNLYPRRNYERTLDVNADVIVANTRELLVVLARRPGKDGSRAATFVLCPSNILCLRAHGLFAYFGIMNGVVCRTDLRSSSRLIANISTECDSVKTAFGDNITSLDVDGDRLAIGDVNGEVHVCSVSGFGSNANRAPDFSLDSGHSYKSYVWCVKLDGERIFSGDRDGKLVVHDFWKQMPYDINDSCLSLSQSNNS